MTDEQILKLAQEHIRYELTTENTLAFARAIAAAENEACAKMCDDVRKEIGNPWDKHGYIAGCANEAKSLGILIRARQGEK